MRTVTKRFSGASLQSARIMIMASQDIWTLYDSERTLNNCSSCYQRLNLRRGLIGGCSTSFTPNTEHSNKDASNTRVEHLNTLDTEFVPTSTYQSQTSHAKCIAETTNTSLVATETGATYYIETPSDIEHTIQTTHTESTSTSDEIPSVDYIITHVSHTASPSTVFDDKSLQAGHTTIEISDSDIQTDHMNLYTYSTQTVTQVSNTKASDLVNSNLAMEDSRKIHNHMLTVAFHLFPWYHQHPLNQKSSPKIALHHLC
ncbi:hypothetical protein PoB_002101700 [Plakobranchus ocellatus]|uniref:Uncharacterized protein n=1 Tax=Plakobranchus ocellatus TaxID=259542 RepID=A0AAV3ZIZ9_9GAST|nr:hypothetical protein PoB_002101700 [Plakobranchus ocellatus]